MKVSMNTTGPDPTKGIYQMALDSAEAKTHAFLSIENGVKGQGEWLALVTFEGRTGWAAGFLDTDTESNHYLKIFGSYSIPITELSFVAEHLEHLRNSGSILTDSNDFRAEANGQMVLAFVRRVIDRGEH